MHVLNLRQVESVSGGTHSVLSTVLVSNTASILFEKLSNDSASPRHSKMAKVKYDLGIGIYPTTTD